MNHVEIHEWLEILSGYLAYMIGIVVACGNTYMVGCGNTQCGWL